MELLSQDVVLAVWLALQENPSTATLAATGAALHLSSSQVHAAGGRARAAGLLKTVDATRRGFTVAPHRGNLVEFLIHGVKYAWPAQRLGETRGVPTSGATRVFRSMFSKPPVPLVWPHPAGAVRGEGLLPLHRCVPEVALDDPGGSRFHDVFALVDALRTGNARERAFATRTMPDLILEQP